MRSDFPGAKDVFEEIMVKNPFLIEGLDVYSNILYVMQDRSKLSWVNQTNHIYSSLSNIRNSFYNFI